MGVQHFQSTLDVSTLAKEAKQDTEISKLDSILTELGQKTEPADQQHVIIDNQNPATETGLAKETTLQNIYTRLGLNDPGIELDSNNHTIISPGASSTYTGTYTRRDHYGYGIILVISNEELASAVVRYSDDGINPFSSGLLGAPTTLTHITPVSPSPFHIYFSYILDLRVAPYYRVEATTTSTNPTVFEVDALWSPFPFQGSFGNLTATLNPQTQYLSTRSVQAGIRESNGNFENIDISEHRRDLANEQVNPLTNAAPVVFTADNTTDLIHSVGHGLVVDQPIWFTNSGGVLPTGLSSTTLYYVAAPVTADDFKCSTARSTTFGHTPVNFTSDGTGTHSYIVPGEFTGTYTRISDVEHFEIIYLSLGTLGLVEKVWSTDGLVEYVPPPNEPILTSRSAIVNNPLQGFNIYYDVNEGRNMAPYYKLHIINGPISQSASATWASITWLMKTPYAGNFGLLNASLNQLSRALLVRAVQAGNDANDSFVNASIQSRSNSNSSTTPLTIGSPVVFTADDSTDLITSVAHGLIVGSPIKFTTTGVLPVPLAENTIYYVSSSGLTANDFKLALLIEDAVSGFNFINLTTVGSGTNSYVPLASFTGTWFEWQARYVGTIVDLIASHNGRLSIDLSGNQAPVNGVNTDVQATLRSDYNPTSKSLLRRVEPTQSRWMRIRFVTLETQTLLKLDTAFVTSAPPVSQVRIDTPLTGSDLAATVRAVGAGQQPDGDVVNLRADGEAFIVRDLLAASGILQVVSTGLGQPRETVSGSFNTDGYNTIEVGIFADVPGTCVIYYCEDVDSLTPTFRLGPTIEYGMDDVGRFENFPIPVGLDGFKATFTNNPTTGQGEFLFAVQLRITAPPPPKSTLDSVIDDDEDALIGKMALMAPDAFGSEHLTIGRDGLGHGLNVHVNNIDDGIVIKPPIFGPQTRQFNLTPTAQRIDLPDITGGTGFRYAEVRNVGNFHAFTKEDDTITELNSQPIFLAGNANYGLPPGTQLWGICENTGGASAITNHEGTISGGTGTNTVNAKVGDNTYASQTAVSETVYVEGYSFSFGVGSTISQVLLMQDARKQSSQFETIGFLEVQTGSAGAVGSVSTTSPLTSGNRTFLAFISREVSAGTLATVTGVDSSFDLDLTWTQVATHNSDDSKRRLDVWIAQGVAVSSQVKFNFSTAPTASHIAVHAYSNVDTSTPVQDFDVGDANSNAPTVPALSSTNKGYVIMAVAKNNAGATTIGSGYTSNSDESGTDGLFTENKAITSTGTETPTATLSGSKHWSAIGVTLSPSSAITPQNTLSYLYNGSPGTSSTSLSWLSSTESTQFLDATADRSWVPADIALVRVISTATTIGAAAIETDRLYLEITETSGATTRVAVTQEGGP